jgi:hypothetical protein
MLFNQPRLSQQPIADQFEPCPKTIFEEISVALCSLNLQTGR